LCPLPSSKAPSSNSWQKSVVSSRSNLRHIYPPGPSWPLQLPQGTSQSCDSPHRFTSRKIRRNHTITTQQSNGGRIVEPHKSFCYIVCSIVSNLVYVIQHPLLGGVSDPDMMSDVNYQFEPLCIFMVIFSGVVHNSWSHTHLLLS
jgi:hypothetical protein